MDDRIATLTAMVAKVERMTKGLPEVPSAREDWSAWRKAQHQHNEALGKALDVLRHAYGAQVFVSPSHSRMMLLGVRAESTGGGARMLANWIDAARPRLRQMAKEAAHG